MPGGKVEFMETLVNAAKRELEETNKNYGTRNYIKMGMVWFRWVTKQPIWTKSKVHRKIQKRINLWINIIQFRDFILLEYLIFN